MLCYCTRCCAPPLGRRHTPHSFPAPQLSINTTSCTTRQLEVAPACKQPHQGHIQSAWTGGRESRGSRLRSITGLGGLSSVCVFIEIQGCWEQIPLKSHSSGSTTAARSLFPHFQGPLCRCSPWKGALPPGPCGHQESTRVLVTPPRSSLVSLGTWEVQAWHLQPPALGHLVHSDLTTLGGSKDIHGRAPATACRKSPVNSSPLWRF